MSVRDVPERLRDGVLLDRGDEVSSPGWAALDDPDSLEQGDDIGGAIATHIGQSSDAARNCADEDNERP